MLNQLVRDLPLIKYKAEILDLCLKQRSLHKKDRKISKFRLRHEKFLGYPSSRLKTTCTTAKMSLA